MANLGPAPKAQFFAADGSPLVGGRVYTYNAGTTTPLATYTSVNGGANSNPILLDSRGECNLWFLPNALYKIKLTDSEGVEIYTVDNIASSNYISNGAIVGSSIANSTMTNSLVSSSNISSSNISGGTIAGAAVSNGTINNTVIGGTAPAEATFTTFSGSWASLPAGTRMLFVQTAAPTGWTKSTSDDNKALRIVSGTAGSGGTVAFTTAFTSQAINGTVGATTLTEAQIPSHTHSYSTASAAQGAAGGSDFIALKDTTGQTTGATGGGGSHTHSLSATAINLAVQYVDAIIAVKN